MRSEIIEAIVSVLQEAETTLPDWVMGLIKEAAKRETNSVARSQLQFMMENVQIARNQAIPLCQDTGLAIFHVEMGRDLVLDFDLWEAIAEGVRIATEKIPLRPNAVDPLTRKNTQDNTGPGIPDIVLDIKDGACLKITAFPKGAGSENMSLVGMLNPADDPFDFIIEAVMDRAANSCPPLFLGIGLGGTFDLAARLAKRALFNMPGNSSRELDLLGRINSLGIGPMGLGGDTTALGVKIEMACCHTASLPVAINFQCWAHRSSTKVIL
jgi:fumarate hydratase subunit alpha